MKILNPLLLALLSLTTSLFPKIRVEGADELKLVYPQERITPELFTDLDIPHFWLSPMDGPNLAANTKSAIDYCLANPQWRLNTQLHKTIGVR